jgi:hypothetical protein
MLHVLSTNSEAAFPYLGSGSAVDSSRCSASGGAPPLALLESARLQAALPVSSSRLRGFSRWPTLTIIISMYVVVQSTSPARTPAPALAPLM